MALLDGQVQIRDLLMGPGTEFEMITFNPWTRSIRAPSQAARAWNNGDWSGSEWYEAAVVDMRICTNAIEPGCAGGPGDRDTWIANRHALTSAFRPIQDSGEEIELKFRYGSREYLMLGRPRLVDPEPAWIRWVRAGGVGINAAFVALDSRIFSAELNCTDEIHLATQAGGLIVPFHLPVLVPGQVVGGGAELINAGTEDAGLLIRIDGPVENPRVVLIRPNGVVQVLRIEVILDTGQWIDIDTEDQTVLLNGHATSSLRGVTTGDFPMLAEGTNELRFLADDFNELATLVACWRDTWL